MNELIHKVTIWADKRNLIRGADSKAQALQLISEAGKLSRTIANRKDCRNDVGECFVAIIVLAAIDEYDIGEFIARSNLSKIDDDHDAISSFMYELWEEFGVLSNAVNKGDSYRAIVDDLLIILSGIAGFYNYSLEECLEVACHKINELNE
jgi:hypothetical protein